MEHRELMLARSPFFEGLEPAAIREINARFSARPMREGEPIFRAGEVPSHVAIVAHGALAVEGVGRDGKPGQLSIVGPSEFAGSIPAFGSARLSMTATPLVDGCALWLSNDAFEGIVLRFAQVGLNALRVVGARLNAAESRASLLAVAPLEQRVARALLDVGRRIGAPWSPAGSASPGVLIDVPLSRQHVAGMCGATPESVSRVLSSWRKQGFIDSGRRWIAITDPAALRRLASGH